MSRLIDADALYGYIQEQIMGTGHGEYVSGYNDAASRILAALKSVHEAPTVDAVPVRHGHWKVFQPGKDFPHFAPSYYCSVCEKNSAFVLDGMEPIPPQLFNRLIYHYCPHCGAKMDGVKDK